MLSRIGAPRDRVPLRVQLVVSLLLLVAIALIVMSTAASAALRGYLIDRVDQQLVSAATPIVARVESGLPFQVGPRIARLALPTQFYAEIRGTGRSGTGDVVLESQLLEPGRQPRPLARPQLTADDLSRTGLPFTVPATGPRNGSWRTIVVPLSDGDRSLVIAQSLDEVQRTAARLLTIEVVVGLGVLAALAGLGYVLVRGSLRPLEQMEATAEAIAAGDLSRRVPEQDPRTEVGRLGRALNGMLGQIESAFRAREASERKARTSEERMRRFVADASHELRTPLTSIRGFAELYRQGAATEPADVAHSMRRIEAEATRMGLLVDDLLLLVRLDHQRPLDRREVDLLTLAVDAVHDAQAVDPTRTIELTVRPSDADRPAPVVLGDEARLRQVVGNLMSNALAHTPAGTRVDVRLGTVRANGAHWAELEVADAGPGLTAEEAERVFERFYRADPSRSRSAGGSGLGLSIVAALTAAHGGTVAVDSTPGHGATFTVRLPCRTA